MIKGQTLPIRLLLSAEEKNCTQLIMTVTENINTYLYQLPLTSLDRVPPALQRWLQILDYNPLPPVKLHPHSPPAWITQKTILFLILFLMQIFLTEYLSVAIGVPM